MSDEQKEILDLMARVDSEHPFAESDLPRDLDTGFSSTAEAKAAFEKTLALRDALRIQHPKQATPDSWIALIDSFSDTEAPEQTLADQITAGWRKLRKSWQETPFVWGGGLVAACALVLLIGQPTGQGNPQGIGSSVINSDPRVINGALGGDFKSKTSDSSETEAVTEEKEENLNLNDLTESVSHRGITGELRHDHCPPPQEELAPSDSQGPNEVPDSCFDNVEIPPADD